METILMAYSDIATVNITISDVAITQQGFGTGIFFSPHRNFVQRVLTISSPSDLDAFGFTANDPAYQAATHYFSQTPSASQMKIGRIDSSTAFTSSNVDDGASYTLTFTNLYDTDGTPIADINVQSDNPADITTLVTDLDAKITADTELSRAVISNVVGNDLILTAISETDVEAGTYNVSYFNVASNLADFTNDGLYKINEAPNEILTAHTQEDGDWYFISSYDLDSIGNQDETFVLAMAAAVQALDAKKQYFVASSIVNNLSPYTRATQAGDSTSLFVKLTQSNYLNTVTFFHQNARSSTGGVTPFVEVAYFGANAVYDAGSVSWSNLPVVGVPVARHPVFGRLLNVTEKGYLNEKRANYVDLVAGVTFIRDGWVVSGEWIDVVRGVHWQEVDMTANMQALLLGQKGGKLTYDDQGIARVRDVVSTSLQRGVNRNFLTSFQVNIPRVTDIDPTKRLTRVLDQVTFTAVLAGAIHVITVNGTVSR